MKATRSVKMLFLAVGLASGFAGCANQPTIAGSRTSSGARSARTFALAVTLPDGSRVSNEQWAAIKLDFQQQLAAAGYELTDDLSRADRIIRVIFSPNEVGSIQGNSTVVSVRPNTAYAYQAPRVSYGTTFASYSPAWGYSTNYQREAMYGYYESSYAGGSAPVTPRVDPPTHSRPNHPVDCPPGSESSSGSRFAHHGEHNGRPTGGGSDGSHRYGPRSDSSSDGSSRAAASSANGGYSSPSSSSSYSGNSSSGSSYSAGSSSAYSSSSAASSSSSNSGSSSSGSTNSAGGSSNHQAN